MMRLPKMDYAAPSTVSDACTLLTEYGEGARLLAGGTDLLVACKLKNIKPDILVSLNRIIEMQGIRVDKSEGLRIGAATSLNEIRNNPYIIQYYKALSESAAAVGARQIQHMGTLGGNICLDTRCMFYNQSDSWHKTRAVCLKMGGAVCHVVGKGKKCYAVFSGDLAPALIALDARITLKNGTEARAMNIGDFFLNDGLRPNIIHQDEILTHVTVPPLKPTQKSIYLKYRVRDAIDFPLAAVAVFLQQTTDGLCSECRIVINAVSSAPIRLTETENLLTGKPLTDDLIEQAADSASRASHPVSNVFGATPFYRRKMIGILTRRALRSLRQP